MSRIVCQFSCGAASAVATKLALAQYGDSCVIVNAFLSNEHSDNRRAGIFIMTAATLKYIRTSQGFMVFPCRTAIHKDVAATCGWAKISAGFVDWDFDGRPFCHGRSDSMELGSRPNDTDALRAEWGMTTPGPLPLTRADRALADDLSKVCPALPLARLS